MEGRICALSVLTLIAFKTSYTRSEPLQSVLNCFESGGLTDGSLDTTSELQSRLNLLNSLYALLPEDTDDLDRIAKRRSLFRFGKRRSLFRFGKRGSILRFGKRPATYDFGDYDNDYNPTEFYGFNEDPRAASFPLAEKRSSLFRFGKKSRDMSSLYERNAIREKKPHTPWRFGKAINEDQEDI